MNFISSWKTRPFLKRQESKRHGGSFVRTTHRIFLAFVSFSLFLFSPPTLALGSRFITAAAFFHSIKIVYIYMYLTKKKRKRNVIIARRARIGRWPRRFNILGHLFVRPQICDRNTDIESQATFESSQSTSTIVDTMQPRYGSVHCPITSDVLGRIADR